MTLQLELSDPLIRQAIEDLENLSFIPAIDKAHILLVANGTKPSMHTGIFIESSTLTSNTSKSERDNLQKLAEIITKLSLCYKLEVREYPMDVESNTPSYTGFVFCIARQMHIAEQLVEARANGDEEREGLLLGFPESSVAAFIKGDVLPIFDQQVSTSRVTADEMKFLNHMVSRDNWENEVSYLAEHADITRRISPEIYNQCIAD